MNKARGTGVIPQHALLNLARGSNLASVKEDTEPRISKNPTLKLLEVENDSFKIEIAHSEKYHEYLEALLSRKKSKSELNILKFSINILKPFEKDIIENIIVKLDTEAELNKLIDSHNPKDAKAFNDDLFFYLHDVLFEGDSSEKFYENSPLLDRYIQLLEHYLELAREELLIALPRSPKDLLNNPDYLGQSKLLKQQLANITLLIDRADAIKEGFKHIFPGKLEAVAEVFELLDKKHQKVLALNSILEKAVHKSFITFVKMFESKSTIIENDDYFKTLDILLYLDISVDKLLDPSYISLILNKKGIDDGTEENISFATEDLQELRSQEPNSVNLRRKYFFYNICRSPNQTIQRIIQSFFKSIISQERKILLPISDVWGRIVVDYMKEFFNLSLKDRKWAAEHLADFLGNSSSLAEAENDLMLFQIRFRKKFSRQ